MPRSSWGSAPPSPPPMGSSFGPLKFREVEFIIPQLLKEQRADLHGGKEMSELPTGCQMPQQERVQPNWGVVSDFLQ